MKPRPLYEQRPLMAVALCYGAGIGAGVFFTWRIFLYAAMLGMALSLIPLLRRLGKSIVPGCMLAALSLGLLSGGSAAHPALPAAGRYQVSGTVWEDTVLRESGSAAGYLSNVRITDEDGNAYYFSKLYWTFTPDEDAPLLPTDGQAVTFSANLYHPNGQVNPYGFDFRLFLLQQGVSVGVSGAAGLTVTGHPGRGIASFIYQIRRALTDRMDAVFGENSALPKTLLLGERDGLPDEVNQQFTDAGLSHLLSISGLHVALLAGSLDQIMGFFLSLKKRTGILMGFLLFYCALLGFPAPVVRAALLMGVERLRRLNRRPHDALTGLAAAFLVILIFSPLSLLSAGFQLSFCAVLGMAAWGGKLRAKLQFLKSCWLRDGIAAAVSATAGSFIPCVQHFHRFSLIGLIINPIMCGLFGLLLPFYFLTSLLGIAYLPLGHLLAIPLEFITQIMLDGVAFFSSLPMAVIRVPQFPWHAVLALAAAALLSTRLILLSKGKKALLTAMILCLSGGIWHMSRCTDVQYIQLAMGQADAALILDGDETILIDAGDYGGDVASYLLATGRDADHVIVTHLHSDHFMGLKKLLDQRVPIGTLYLPAGAGEQEEDRKCLAFLDEIRESGVPIIFLGAGDELIFDRVRITVLWPDRATLRTGQDANLYSLAMLCELDGVKLMTAGDLTGTFENYAARDADILKVAHHGSKNGTGENYLKTVSPAAALITGRGGNAILPHADTLSRLAQQGVSVYNTGEWGALTLRIRDGEAIITPYLAYVPPEEEE